MRADFLKVLSYTMVMKNRAYNGIGEVPGGRHRSAVQHRSGGYLLCWGWLWCTEPA